jgi:hypothetical protein
MYRFTWTKTGDSFDVEPVHQELSAWFVEQCNIQSNKFCTGVYDTDYVTQQIESTIEQAKAALHSTNTVLSKFNFQTLAEPNWFDQQQLNILHKSWINVLQTNPGFETVLFHMNREAFDQFHKLNRLIHAIENSFKYELRSHLSWRSPNPFPAEMFDTGVFNVSILYVDHGRNAMEKFKNFDANPNDHELSPWRYIGGSLEINLVRPYQDLKPQEFVEYCWKHNIKAQPDRLPFGNLVNCSESLAPARKIMTHNHQLADNFLTIETL